MYLSNVVLCDDSCSIDGIFNSSSNEFDTIWWKFQQVYVRELVQNHPVVARHNWLISIWWRRRLSSQKILNNYRSNNNHNRQNLSTLLGKRDEWEQKTTMDTQWPCATLAIGYLLIDVHETSYTWLLIDLWENRDLSHVTNSYSR
jgi:predicted O-linked N-acetylglucosamine transferase (SPINDLY family)